MKKHVLILSVIFSLVYGGKTFAQADTLLIPPDTIEIVPDSVVIVQEDKVEEPETAVDSSLIYLPDGGTVIVTDLKPVSTFVPNPRKAVIYSAIFPGLGQIYNRKYWKVPIIYGGFVGLAYGINWNGQYYKDYKQAYKDFIDKDDTTNSFLNMLPAGQDPNNIDASWFTSVLNQKKDFYRRNRDLCIIGMVGVYALAILDAFVDAQLFEFDISQDLTLNISPQVQPGRNSSSVGLYCQFNF